MVINFWIMLESRTVNVKTRNLRIHVEAVDAQIYKIRTLFIIRGKTRTKDNTSRWVSVSLNERLSGSRGHVGGTRPGQTRKKPKDLSVREGEDRGGRGELIISGKGRDTENTFKWVSV